MVRKLYLLRHGEAEQATGNDKDFDRNLTYAGIMVVKQLSEYLKSQNFKPEIVYSSPSARTEQTTIFLMEGLSVECEIVYVEDIYEASVRTLYDIVTHIDNQHHEVLLVGHNPGLTYLAEYLTNEDTSGMRPGQLVKIEFGVNTWGEIAKGLGSIAN